MVVYIISMVVVTVAFCIYLVAELKRLNAEEERRSEVERTRTGKTVK